jgi:branched-subunit amino acid aminotransferase/4-amino-4-deoxychorismate lyase
VFDTCNVVQGRCYGLDFHLDRLLSSAFAARIEMRHEGHDIPTSVAKEHLKQVVLQTIAASGRHDGIFVRYWLSAARGDFMVSPRKCLAMSEYEGPLSSPEIGGAQFYCMVHEGGSRDKALAAADGITEALVPHDAVPHKPPLLANTKTNNYLLNALTSM